MPEFLSSTFYPPLDISCITGYGCDIQEAIPDIPYEYAWSWGIFKLTVDNPSGINNFGFKVDPLTDFNRIVESDDSFILSLPYFIKSYNHTSNPSINISLLLSDDSVYEWMEQCDDFIDINNHQKWNKLVRRRLLPQGITIKNYQISIKASNVVESEIYFGIPEVYHLDIDEKINKTELFDICNKLYQNTYNVLEKVQSESLYKKYVVEDISTILKTDKINYRGKVYDLAKNNEVALVASIDMIKQGEISKAKELLKDIVTHSIFNNNFSNMIEIFINGVKIPYEKIKLICIDQITYFILPNDIDTTGNIVFIQWFNKLNNLYSETDTIILPDDTLESHLEIYLDGHHLTPLQYNIINNVITATNIPSKYFEVVINKYLISKEILTDPTYESITETDFPISTYNMKLFKNGLLVSNPNIEFQSIGIYKFTNILGTNTLHSYYYIPMDNRKYQDIVTKFTIYENYLEKLKLDTLPPFIKNYVKLNMSMNNKSFDNNKEDIDELKTKLRGAIVNDISNYQKYLDKIIEKNNYYYRVGDIPLTNKTKLNSNDEGILPSEKMIFDSSRIMISFFSNNHNFNIFYNGLLLFNNVYFTFSANGFQYVYIDTTMLPNAVSDDDIIEVNINPGEIQYQSEDFISGLHFCELDTIPNLKTTPNDFNLFIKDADNRYIEIPDREWSISIVDNKYKLHVSYEIVMKTLKLINTNFYKRFDIVTDMYSVKSQVDLLLSSFDINHLKVYVNGKYISRNYLIRLLPLETNETTSYEIATLFYNNGQPANMIVEYTPYPTYEIYKSENIPSDGLIRLDPTKLRLPLSLNYYEIYLNGKKINNTQELTISDSFIQLKNINTIKNIIIIQKYNLKDLFSNLYINIIDRGYDDYLKSLGDLTPYLGLIDEIIDNETSYLSLFTRKQILYLLLYDYHIKDKTVNSLVQTNKDILTNYDGLINEQNLLLLNASEEQIKPMPI